MKLCHTQISHDKTAFKTSVKSHPHSYNTPSQTPSKGQRFDLISFTQKYNVVAAATSSIRYRDCSREVDCLSARPSTPSTPSQNTCCHCNQKTNPKAAAALSVAERVAACHHRPVTGSTSRCQSYLCTQHFAVEQVMGLLYCR